MEESIAEGLVQENANQADVSTVQLISEPDAALEYVGFLPRAGAWIIDTLIMNALLIVFSSIMAFIVGFILSIVSVALGADPVSIVDNIFNIEYSYRISVFSILMVVLIHAASESIGGATLGKWILGLIVISDHGGLISFLDGIKRALAFGVDALFWGLVAYLVMRETPKKKRLGDKWAHSVVVRRKSLPEERIPSSSRLGWVIAVTIAIVFLYSGLIQLSSLIFGTRLF